MTKAGDIGCRVYSPQRSHHGATSPKQQFWRPRVRKACIANAPTESSPSFPNFRLCVATWLKAKVRATVRLALFRDTLRYSSTLSWTTQVMSRQGKKPESQIVLKQPRQEHWLAWSVVESFVKNASSVAPGTLAGLRTQTENAAFFECKNLNASPGPGGKSLKRKKYSQCAFWTLAFYHASPYVATSLGAFH